MKHFFLAALLFCAAFSGAANAKVVGQEVSYRSEGTTLKGYLAYDDAIQGKRPGVLVVHEWWGHNAYARGRADMLAAMGYTALAVDMYGDGQTADHPSKAGEFSGAVLNNYPLMKARFNAARDFLNTQSVVDATKNAAIGYCFGGAVVLNMAREGQDLKAVGSFHGNLATLTTPKKGGIKARLFIANGAADPFIPAEAVAAFKKEMDEAGAKYTFRDYAGAMHGFTNPEATKLGQKFQLPLKYDSKADKESWSEFAKFLKESFR